MAEQERWGPIDISKQECDLLQWNLLPRIPLASRLAAPGSDWPSGESGDFPNSRSNGHGIMQKNV